MIQKRYVDTTKLITNAEKLKLTATEVLIYYGDKWYGEVAIDLEGKEEKFEELKSAIVYVAKNLYKMDLIAQEYITLHGDSRFADGYEVAYIRFDTLDEISVTYYGIQVNTEFDVVFQCVNNDFLLKSFGRNKNIPPDWNRKIIKNSDNIPIYSPTGSPERKFPSPNRKPIIPAVSVLIALVCAALLFLNWNPEVLFRRDEAPVTMGDIKQDGVEDFTGAAAGGDIPRLTGAADFSEMLFEVDYMTAEPVGIVPTGVYSLKAWVSHYNTNTYKGRTSTGSRRVEVTQSSVDILGNYNPYYLLELPDRSYILAQIPQAEAAAIAKGESVTLPVSRKVGMTDTARNYLAGICEEYGADMDGVLYAFDNEWQEEHHNTLLLLRFGAAALLWFVLAVGLTLAGNEILLKKDGHSGNI